MSRDSLKDCWDFRIATLERSRKQRRMGRRTNKVQTRRTSKRSKENSGTGMAFGEIREWSVAKRR